MDFSDRMAAPATRHPGYQVILRCVEGPDKGRKWRRIFAHGTTVVLGRLEGCHILLQDPKVSESHCLLQIQRGSLCLVDMGSFYGTAVNGREASSAVALSDGDTISLGNTRLILEVVSPKSASREIARQSELEPEPKQEAEPEEPEPSESGESPLVTAEIALPVVPDAEDKGEETETPDMSPACSFCTESSESVRVLHACRCCERCESVARFFLQEAADCKICGRPWYDSPYLVVLPVRHREDRKLLAISRVERSRAQRNPEIESEDVARHAHAHVYPVLERTGESRFAAFLPWFPGSFLSHPLQPSEAFDAIGQMALAAEHASEHWGFHGEICPGSMYLEVTGHAYLFGCGLMREIFAPPESAGKNPTARECRAPERICSRSPATEASEIFSLAASLHFLLTSHSVYGGSHQDPRERARSFEPNLDFFQPPLRNFFRVALAREPGDRYPKIEHFADALNMVRCFSKKTTGR